MYYDYSVNYCFVLFCFVCVCFLVTGVLSKHIDHRNLFTQRMCCKRQSQFVYIGQGKAPHHTTSSG